jgi:L-asparaginase II
MVHESFILGCTVPAFITPLFNFALGFARLADSESIKDEKLSDACELIFSSMTKYPFMVAGTNGFCTELMHHYPSIIGKVGAEGVYGSGIKE